MEDVRDHCSEKGNLIIFGFYGGDLQYLETRGNVHVPFYKRRIGMVRLPRDLSFYSLVQSDDI